MLVFAWCVCVYVQTLYSDDEHDGSAETNDPHGLMLGSSLGEVRTNITVTIYRCRVEMFSVLSQILRFIGVLCIWSSRYFVAGFFEFICSRRSIISLVNSNHMIDDDMMSTFNYSNDTYICYVNTLQHIA
jgi:hypothetical protein